MAKSKTSRKSKSTKKNLRAKSAVGSLRVDEKKNTIAVNSAKIRSKTKSKVKAKARPKSSKSLARSKKLKAVKKLPAPDLVAVSQLTSDAPVVNAQRIASLRTRAYERRMAIIREVKARLRFLAKLSVVLIVVGSALTAFAIVRLKPRIEAEISTPVLPIADKVITESVVEPSESKPETPTEKNVDLYVVPAEDPRRIIVPQLGINGYIQKVGLDKTNTVVVPDNIHFAGWYTSSSKPGAEGVSLVAGHVGGRYNDAIFKRLNELSAGSKFQIEYGDLSIRNFVVVDKKQMSEKDASDFMLQPRAGLSKQLNLITCGGAFNQTTARYADRVIVVSKLVE